MSATTTAYAWDKTTNRTSVQVGAGTATTTTFDAANRPTVGTNPTLTYANDADGRLTARTGETMTYDHLGRLTAVNNAAGTVTLAAYTYDPLDRLRMIDYGAGNRVRFRYVGMTTSVAQWIDDAAGTVTRSVGNGWDGQHLLDWTGTNSYIRIYGENAHHDVTWLASSTGTVSQALRYDPWGNGRVSAPVGYTPFRFQGSYYDATTDLSWVVTRWYAPLQGRFMTEDTLMGTPADPPSRQLYAYAQGDPVGAWDPGGEVWIRTQIKVRTRVIDAVDHLSADTDLIAQFILRPPDKLQRLEWVRAGATPVSEHPFGLFFAYSGWKALVASTIAFRIGNTLIVGANYRATGDFTIEPAQGIQLFHAHSNLSFSNSVSIGPSLLEGRFAKTRWDVDFSGVSAIVFQYFPLPGLGLVLPLTKEAVRPDTKVNTTRWRGL